MKILRAAVLAVASIGLVATPVVWSPLPAAADAGADLAYSVLSGPPGTTFVLSSKDVFDMGVDLCPGPVGPDTPEGAYEVRWELAPLASPGGTLLGDEIAVVSVTDAVGSPVASGSMATTAGVPWSTTVRVPDDVAAGTGLVVHASCTRADAPAEVLFGFYYMPVFLVTEPGSVPSPTNVPPTTVSTTTVAVAPGGSTAGAEPATARPGRPTFTG